jgi:hypothetical protein
MRRRGQLSLHIEITVRNRAGRATIDSDEVQAVSP